MTVPTEPGYIALKDFNHARAIMTLVLTTAKLIGWKGTFTLNYTIEGYPGCTATQICTIE